jgi:hypothetical protein
MQRKLPSEVEDLKSLKYVIERSRNLVERTVSLTWFYANARFKVTESDFNNKYHVDKSNDGGIDFCFFEGNTFYILQSKYHEKSQQEKLKSIIDELNKIEKTIIGENTNKLAAEFVNHLKRELNNNSYFLEIIWLTTNEVSGKTKSDSQSALSSIIEKHNWQINGDINFIDITSLESVIYDIKHGYIPHTGKKELYYEPGEFMDIEKGTDKIDSFVCSAKVTNIISWFKDSFEISKYLQKNVRESVGDNIINKGIKDSFIKSPSLFWYKHNGIIIFCDWLERSEIENKITIRNPQIVNGAQTITQLYKAHDENRNSNNPAKVLVRLYRLPYEDTETYTRSIDIIAALNSQNKILRSDLRSTDPRQIMVENRILEVSNKYTYNRKRSESAKFSSPTQIFMTKLALFYSVCDNKRPDEGISGQIESYFEENSKYNEVFPEKTIKHPLNNKLNNIIVRYIECWRFYHIIDRTMKAEILKEDRDLFKLVRWYCLADVYQQIQNWKEIYFKSSWREWLDFIEYPRFEEAIVKYSKKRFGVYVKFLPKGETEARNFYKSKDARQLFLADSGNSQLFNKEMQIAFTNYNK